MRVKQTPTEIHPPLPHPKQPPPPTHTQFMYIVYLRRLSKRNEQEGVAATGSSEYLEPGVYDYGQKKYWGWEFLKDVLHYATTTTTK